MAYKNSNPLINGCCTDCGGDENGSMGLVIDNSSAMIVKGADTVTSLSLKDVFLPVAEYGTQEFTLPASTSYAINSGLVSNPNGTLNAIVMVATYPTVDAELAVVDESKKYVTINYGTTTMPMGKIMILSGTDELGWFMSSSPGNLTISNPHDNFAVTVKVMYTSMATTA